MTTKPPESALELRRKAEKLAIRDDLKILEEQHPEDSPQIIHELLVHQVELEIQNEELRLAQQELSAAKARYFELYNMAPVGYLTVNEGGLIQDANLTAATMLGVSRGILLQNVLSKFIHPEDEDNYYLHRKQLITTRELQTWDMRLMRAGGSIFWAHMKCTATNDGDSWITFTDITERKQAEAALRQASAYNRCLIEASLDPLVTIGPDGRITDTNHATMAITGVSREELVGSMFSDYFSDPDAATAGYRKVFLEGTVRDYPLEIAHRDGQLIPVLYNATLFRDSDGSVAGVFAAARDISSLILYKEVLRESEEAYRTVADFTYDWEYWITPDGSMRYTSPSCQLHTGYRAEEFMKDPELVIEITHPDDRERFDCHLPPDQSGLVEGARKHENDFRIITRSGEVRWFAHVCQPVYGSKGKYLGQRASNRDITDRKQAEKALQESNRKLEVMSITDGLTGVANRRHFDEVLAREYTRHVRSKALLSLIMLDIDHFKAFNDSYGHVSGDDCLRQIGLVIADCTTRAADLPARYGGEEFACILPETDSVSVVGIAEKIRQGILALGILHNGSSTAEFVTASLGVVTVQCTIGGSAVDIVSQADELLYRAKSSGRNRVEFITNFSSVGSSVLM